MLSISLIAVIVLALVFDAINGFHDSANSIATSVSTRVLSPMQAVLMAAVLNFVGAMFSHKVAKTISGGVVNGSLPEYVIVSAIIAAIIWDLITWYFGIPSSSSHALIGALVGAAIAYTSSTDAII
jgi:PiT family inorganic phosphate transporter